MAVESQPAFSRYVIVDWSAARPPNRGANSIWIADLGAAGAGPRLTNPASQPEAMAQLDAIVEAADGRVLIGIDACLGAVRGLDRHVPGPPGPPWRRLWAHCASRLADDLENKWELVEELNELVGLPPGGCAVWLELAGRAVELPQVLVPRGEDLPYEDDQKLESDWHRNVMNLLIHILRYHWRQRQRWLSCVSCMDPGRSNCR